MTKPRKPRIPPPWKDMAVGDSNAQPGPEARLAAIFAEAEAKLGMRFKIDTGGMQCTNPSWFVVKRVS